MIVLLWWAASLIVLGVWLVMHWRTRGTTRIYATHAALQTNYHAANIACFGVHVLALLAAVITCAALALITYVRWVAEYGDVSTLF